MKPSVQFSSVQFSRSVVSDSLWPNGLQLARPPCPSPTPRVHLDLCPLSCWCHPTISSSVVPFSAHLQSFPASGSFQMSQLFASGGQTIGVSASASVLPMNIQDWFPLGWTGWISSQSKGLSRVFSNTTVQKHQFFGSLQIWFGFPCMTDKPTLLDCLNRDAQNPTETSVLSSLEAMIPDLNLADSIQSGPVCSLRALGCLLQS